MHLNPTISELHHHFVVLPVDNSIIGLIIHDGHTTSLGAVYHKIGRTSFDLLRHIVNWKI